ncbi:hypothetical protein [Pseudonocardia sp. N23]|uniref:hypothetical protein n=1 Tax=Pseudonocardia sp. N23 TaxID=1987376 RepID=UPI000C028FC3|nr:hypothetical protein [Pseudonocardia sp. N23]GAY11116.1 hypothetical protein TOK_5602 [Pseudonocardia sp. N23]
MIDRYAEAERMRRVELTAQRAGLTGYRTEVRTVCALARVSAQSQVTTVATALAAELVQYADRACRTDRARLPGYAAVAADRAVGSVVERVGRELLPELRRVATVRGLPVAVVDSAVGRADVPRVVLPAAPPPARPWQAASGAGGTWRTVLPWLGLPVVGAPAVTGTVGPAVGCGVALLVVSAGARWTAADRARLRRWAPGVATAVRVAASSAVVALLVQAEQRVCAALDVATAARLTAIDEELAAPGRSSCVRT